MLRSLHFQNWRSLRDVKISGLKPINVFIGANASGKTNLLDGFYFLREVVEQGVLEATYARRGEGDIRTLGVPREQPISLEFSYSGSDKETRSYQLTLQSDDRYSERLRKGQKQIMYAENGLPEITDEEGNTSRPESLKFRTALAEFANIGNPEIRDTFLYITQRWQLLDENFMPPLTISSSDLGNLYVIDRCAENLVPMLDFMAIRHQPIFASIQEDLRWLLKHIDEVKTKRTDRETRLQVQERLHPDHEAPTVSAGTARIISMLVAYYALDMRFPERPGLVVIEEPDMSIHPLLLKEFVELLRSYTEREQSRQFILTTHNPRLLDYFKPEEVRIVRRDDHGYTVVDSVPKHIDEIWLHEYGLGEVWMTHAFEKAK